MLKNRSKAASRGKEAKTKELTVRISGIIAENRKNWGKSDTRGSQNWWRKVDNISVLDNSFLEGLNNYFGHLCCNSEYVEPAMVQLDPGSATTPTLDEYQVMLVLSKIKKSAARPDGIHHWVWKDNAQQLAPVITAVWNLSLRRHTWPLAWKQANINPLPKLDTPIEYQDFRGINVTPIIARCFERTVYQAFSKPVFVKYRLRTVMVAALLTP